MDHHRPEHAGSEHVITLPDRADADRVAHDLSEEGFACVQVAEVGETRWSVRVTDARLPDAEGSAAYEALRERFVDLARELHGRYEEPGDPRPPEPS